MGQVGSLAWELSQAVGAAKKNKSGGSESRAKKARSEGTVGSSPHCSWREDCGEGVGGEGVLAVGRGDDDRERSGHQIMKTLPWNPSCPRGGSS